MKPPVERLSPAQARRVALAAQGLHRPSQVGPVSPRALAALAARLGAVQIDSVNVLVRAHYLPAFSRLGPYDRAALDRLSHRAPRRLFEYWGHEASLLPVALHPLLRWRMDRARDEAWGGMRRIASEKPDLVRWVLAEVRDRGPLTAGEIEHDVPRPVGNWGWNWSEAKRALEFLFWAGEVTASSRRGFERLYDLPERVLPRDVLDAPTPEPRAAFRELLRRAARAHGIATARCLRDYYRLPVQAMVALEDLVEEGEVSPVTVQGWRRPAYLHREAKLPRRADGRALLAPFDPLVWERERTEALFGFRYRLEIYVPQGKRVHGYYVLPFLLGDRLVARVDLKADRQGCLLRVQAAWAEPDAPSETAEALAAELRVMAGWLGLDGVAVGARGDLAVTLAAAVAAG